MFTKKITILSIILFSGVLFAGNSDEKKVISADAAKVEELGLNPTKNEKIFESVEIEILFKLSSLGIPIETPKAILNTSTADYKTSLNLGLAVAGSLTSVINKNSNIFTEYATNIHDYADRLGVENTILSKYSEMTNAVRDGKWENVEHQIYELKDAISERLYEEDMKSEAVLAMASGWIEGLHIVAQSLNRNFSDKANQVIADRDFSRYLTFHLDTLNEDIKSQSEIELIYSSLPQIDKIINKPVDYEFSQKDVKAILSITEEIRNAILR